MPRSAGSRAKKRKNVFAKGNNAASKAKCRPPKDIDSNDEEEIDVNVDRDSVSVLTTPNVNPPIVSPTHSRSKIKLENRYGTASVIEEDSSSSEDDALAEDKCDLPTTLSDGSKENNSGFRIIDFQILRNQIKNHLVCRHCFHPSELVEESRSGLGSVFRFVCENTKCNSSSSSEKFYSDQTIKSKGSSGFTNHSINRRAALAMRFIGCGLSALSTFCGIMNLPPPVAKPSYQKIKQTICEAVETVQSRCMKAAAGIEFSLVDHAEGGDTSPRDIDTSLDGTFLTRGFSSKIGVVTAIGCATGKVIDTEVRSKVCKGCDSWSKKKNTHPIEYARWLARHKSSCEATHEGSSGSMESKSAVDIYSRSVQKNNLRYTRYVGDGDTNSFKSVLDSKPYGEEKPIEKVECVGHVQKRMGTRLRKLKKNYIGKKLKDGKGIGGANRLTDNQIDQIQVYFGNAIRGNKNDVVGMRESIWAVFFHKVSTDKIPRHHLCNISWCKYLQAKRDGNLKNYKHSNNIPAAVMEVVKPIFKDLTHPDLLNRCLDGYTQNANESVNQKIWKICPKNTFHGAGTVKIAVGLATITFNDGMKSLVEVLSDLDITCGIFAQRLFVKQDSERIKQAEIRQKESSKEYRRLKRKARIAADELNEDGAYASGAHAFK